MVFEPVTPPGNGNGLGVVQETIQDRAGGGGRYIPIYSFASELRKTVECSGGNSKMDTIVYIRGPAEGLEELAEHLKAAGIKCSRALDLQGRAGPSSVPDVTLGISGRRCLPSHNRINPA